MCDSLCRVIFNCVCVCVLQTPACWLTWWRGTWPTSCPWLWSVAGSTGLSLDSSSVSFSSSVAHQHHQTPFSFSPAGKDKKRVSWTRHDRWWRVLTIVVLLPSCSQGAVPSDSEVQADVAARDRPAVARRLLVITDTEDTTALHLHLFTYDGAEFALLYCSVCICELSVSMCCVFNVGLCVSLLCAGWARRPGTSWMCSDWGACTPSYWARTTVSVTDSFWSFGLFLHFWMRTEDHRTPQWLNLVSSGSCWPGPAHAGPDDRRCHGDAPWPQQGLQGETFMSSRTQVKLSKKPIRTIFTSTKHNSHCKELERRLYQPSSRPDPTRPVSVWDPKINFVTNWTF